MTDAEINRLFLDMTAALENTRSVERETQEMLGALKEDCTVSRYQSAVTQRMRETEARQHFFALRNQLFEALRPPRQRPD